jgi:hypothetical protein
MKFELKRNIGQMAGWFDNEIKKLCCWNCIHIY